MSAPALRRPDGSEYPPDILFLADIFGVEPESIMRSGRSPGERTNGPGDSSSGSIDPCKFSE